MSVRVEDRSFCWRDRAAVSFFREHGYVVVDDALDDRELGQAAAAWADVNEAAAQRAGLGTATFVERFPQNRDLWLKDPRFGELLTESDQPRVAMAFLETSGTRLFHDHAIYKPSGRSSAIPWHQDAAGWPVDQGGLSVWSPTSAVGVDGGCLKLLDGSHRDPLEEPQDFLADDHTACDGDERLVLLPVRRGQSVVLDALTWHGSDANHSSNDRLAYLTLWIPGTSRFRPESGAWHPTAAHIRVAAGERIEGDRFPLFGSVAEHDERPKVAYPRRAAASGPSMFTASRDISTQIGWLLGDRVARPLIDRIAQPAVRDAAAAALVEQGFVQEHERAVARTVLDELHLQERVRTESVARDPYLRGVSRWWELAGRALADRIVQSGA